METRKPSVKDMISQIEARLENMAGPNDRIGDLAAADRSSPGTIQFFKDLFRKGYNIEWFNAALWTLHGERFTIRKYLTIMTLFAIVYKTMNPEPGQEPQDPQLEPSERLVNAILAPEFYDRSMNGQSNIRANVASKNTVVNKAFAKYSRESNARSIRRMPMFETYNRGYYDAN
tara:strand:+ start:18314 stop:18835 length:522 start_codon:yes stop_codon:yes gene_type:complete